MSKSRRSHPTDPGPAALGSEPGPSFPDTQVSGRHPSPHRVPTVYPRSPGQEAHTSRLTGRAFQFAVIAAKPAPPLRVPTACTLTVPPSLMAEMLFCFVLDFRFLSSFIGRSVFSRDISVCVCCPISNSQDTWNHVLFTVLNTNLSWVTCITTTSCDLSFYPMVSYNF